ncbi:hypothetical protein SCLCIDRAFT_1218787 [Scleroderma citrinum Foug A]|uniref:Uncharacterized protein n=1 Tax=Scleroderma citrinum Foug A TaxID=1036808 RepID=A0A0C2Z8I9_9AGAM|nr:hypothetical protein SCLCIDRAFT_1218787 [Scleroderma citrinum Foug A]
MPPAKRTYTQSSEPGVTLVACDHCHALFLPRGVKSHQIYCFHGPEKVRRRRGDTAAKVAEAQMKRASIPSITCFAYQSYLHPQYLQSKIIAKRFDDVYARCSSRLLLPALRKCSSRL